MPSDALPKKLKRDALIEVLAEIQFDRPPRTAPEVLLGRLVDHPAWEGFEHRRFPIAELPPAMRAANPEFKYAPVIELKEADGGVRAVRIGPNVVSYHRRAPYVGWSNFQPEIVELVDHLFSKAPGLSITKLNLRYINALNAADHEVGSVADLTLTVTIDSEKLVGSLGVASHIKLAQGAVCTLRVATPDFVQSPVFPEGTACVVDVSVYKDAPGVQTAADVVAWMEFAHTEEKKQFFRLFDEQKIARLREL